MSKHKNSYEEEYSNIMQEIADSFDATGSIYNEEEQQHSID